jgi:hypothetical protein
VKYRFYGFETLSELTEKGVVLNIDQVAMFFCLKIKFIFSHKLALIEKQYLGDSTFVIQYIVCINLVCTTCCIYNHTHSLIARYIL